MPLFKEEEDDKLDLASIPQMPSVVKNEEEDDQIELNSIPQAEQANQGQSSRQHAYGTRSVTRREAHQRRLAAEGREPAPEPARQPPRAGHHHRRLARARRRERARRLAQRDEALARVDEAIAGGTHDMEQGQQFQTNIDAAIARATRDLERLNMAQAPADIGGQRRIRFRVRGVPAPQPPVQPSRIVEIYRRSGLLLAGFDTHTSQFIYHIGRDADFFITAQNRRCFTILDASHDPVFIQGVTHPEIEYEQ
ncbi:Uu.00g126040.m01.CDS01 [Anthostomella pinea]|uniref:Uu.00g126040.m01.CDS01 n=1 Tax=Anthostomella pinea TaxID=933095 RepID=A0AAI8VHW3_9PEZI|nr:Uu.00g126040.m01.CDS01 [Anthostomella pinea]